MRFQVPQFIEVEDKIFGPLTIKQFIYLAGGAGVTVASFSLLPKIVAFLISAPVVILALALTFYKVNNRTFIVTLESFFKYMTGKKLYIWKRDEKKVTGSGQTGTNNPEVFIPHLSNSKLKDLSWSLDVTQAKGVDGPEEKDVSVR